MKPKVRKIKCSEIWGGIKNNEQDVCSAGITASLYSSSCDGGKGGDAYYFSVCGTDSLTRVALADVVGHGEQVSAVSQWVYDQLESHMNDMDQPAMMQALNDQVADRGFEAMTTAVLLSYYLPNRHLYFSYAGHPPMLFRRSGRDWTEVQLSVDSADNLPLGVKAGANYDMGETPFEPGDRLFLFSDGVLEAPAPNGDQFGEDRLRDALNAAGDGSPYDLKQAVLAALREWTGGELTHDDVTLIALQMS